MGTPPARRTHQYLKKTFTAHLDQLRIQKRERVLALNIHLGTHPQRKGSLGTLVGTGTMRSAGRAMAEVVAAATGRVVGSVRRAS